MKQIYIESSLASFEDFHDGEWFQRLFDRAAGLAIEPIIEEFAAHWWGAARAFVLPWLMVNGVFDASRGANGKIRDRQEMWNKYLEFDSFRGALWKTAEGAYGAIYYAYENLLVNILNASANSTVRVTQNDFNSVVSTRLGESLAGKVWNNSFVAVSKEVRNCLVHRGGKATRALLKMQPLPRIEGEEILISASDVRQLHGQLKPRVVLLIENYGCYASS